MNVSILNVPEGTYFLEVCIADKTEGKKHAIVNTNQYSQYKQTYIVYDDKDGQIIRSDNDSYNRLINDAVILASEYSKLSSSNKLELSNFINSDGYQIWSWLYGDALDLSQSNLVKSAYLADAIMYSLSSKDASQITFDIDIFKDILEYIDQEFELLNEYTDLQFSEYFKHANAVTTIIPGTGYLCTTSDPDAIKSALKQIKSDIKLELPGQKLIEIADRLYNLLTDYSVYTNVSPADLQAVIDNLEYAKGSPLLDATREILMCYISNGKLNTDNMKVMLAGGYLGDWATEKLLDAYADLISSGGIALGNLVGIGPFMIGAKIGEALMQPLVNYIGNINQLQEKVYRTLWAFEAADSYFATYLQTIEDFRTAPIANYGKMVEASSTFCYLYSNVVKAYANTWEEFHSSFAQMTKDFFSRYNVNAEKAHWDQMIQFYMNFLRQDCMNFYQDFAKPNGQKFIEWGLLRN